MRNPSCKHVGYNTYTMHEGYNIYTPTFESITATDKKLNLQDLKLINTYGYQSEAIWLFNEDGTAVNGHTYSWQSTEITGLEKDCWIDDETGVPAEDVYINEGDGFYLNCVDTGIDETGVKVQVAGSVKIDKFSHTMYPGYNLTGNFCPKSIDIQGLKLLNTYGYQSEAIWELNEDGTSVTGHTYSWQSTEITGLEKDCWIDDETGNPAEDVTLVPGEGIYLNCVDAGIDETGVIIEIDPVLIKE